MADDGGTLTIAPSAWAAAELLPVAAAPRRRRSQAERSASTRDKLVAAAIACLNRAGYSATTITTVADEAGVSRGAMTHQFPAKTDLMLAVVQAVVEEDGRLHDAAAERMGLAEWMNRLPETMWSVISRPAGIAVMEIMLASRSDPDLATKLRNAQTAIDANARIWVDRRLRAAGFAPPAEMTAIHELCVAAVRGLALQATFMDDQAGVHRSLSVLSDMMRHVFPPAAASKDFPA